MNIRRELKKPCFFQILKDLLRIRCSFLPNEDFQHVPYKNQKLLSMSTSLTKKNPQTQQRPCMKECKPILYQTSHLQHGSFLPYHPVAVQIPTKGFLRIRESFRMVEDAALGSGTIEEKTCGRLEPILLWGQVLSLQYVRPLYWVELTKAGVTMLQAPKPNNTFFC